MNFVLGPSLVGNRIFYIEHKTNPCTFDSSLFLSFLMESGYSKITLVFEFMLIDVKVFGKKRREAL